MNIFIHIYNISCKNVALSATSFYYNNRIVELKRCKWSMTLLSILCLCELGNLKEPTLKMHSITCLLKLKVMAVRFNELGYMPLWVTIVASFSISTFDTILEKENKTFIKKEWKGDVNNFFFYILLIKRLCCLCCSIKNQ